jgi:hypothetical protein
MSGQLQDANTPADSSKQVGCFDEPPHELGPGQEAEAN